MDSKTLFEAAEFLKKQAEILQMSERLMGPQATGERGMWENPTAKWPLPAGIVTKDNPYGAGKEWGTPGWQVSLRKYAREDGYSDSNYYVKSKGLKPLWKDEKMDFED